MANRYWVGGTGNWRSTSHWSNTSGGPITGFSIPTDADDVFFDGNSGGGTCTLDVVSGDQINYVNNLNCSGYTGTFTALTTIITTLNIAGNLTLSTGMTISKVQNLVISGSGNRTITSANVPIGGTLTLTNGIIATSVGNLIVTSSLTIGKGIEDAVLKTNGNVNVGTLTLTNGTITTTGTTNNEINVDGTLTINSGSFNTRPYKIKAESFTINSAESGVTGFTRNINISELYVNTNYNGDGNTVNSNTIINIDNLYVTGGANTARTIQGSAFFKSPKNIYITGSGQGIYKVYFCHNSDVYVKNINTGVTIDILSAYTAYAYDASCGSLYFTGSTAEWKTTVGYWPSFYRDIKLQSNTTVTYVGDRLNLVGTSSQYITSVGKTFVSPNIYIRSAGATPTTPSNTIAVDNFQASANITIDGSATFTANGNLIVGGTLTQTKGNTNIIGNTTVDTTLTITSGSFTTSNPVNVNSFIANSVNYKKVKIGDLYVGTSYDSNVTTANYIDIDNLYVNASTPTAKSILGNAPKNAPRYVYIQGGAAATGTYTVTSLHSSSLYIENTGGAKVVLSTVITAPLASLTCRNSTNVALSASANIYAYVLGDVTLLPSINSTYINGIGLVGGISQTVNRSGKRLSRLSVDYGSNLKILEDLSLTGLLTINSGSFDVRPYTASVGAFTANSTGNYYRNVVIPEFFVDTNYAGGGNGTGTGNIMNITNLYITGSANVARSIVGTSNLQSPKNIYITGSGQGTYTISTCDDSNIYVKNDINPVTVDIRGATDGFNATTKFKGIYFSGLTSATWNTNAGYYNVFTGDIKLQPNTTVTYIGSKVYLNGTGIQRIICAGKQFVTPNLIIQNQTGLNPPTIIMEDDFSLSGIINLNGGPPTLTAKGNVTISNMVVYYNQTANINMGSGTWRLTGTGDVWDTGLNATSINAETSTIKIVNESDSDITFGSNVQSTGRTYYNMEVTRGPSTGTTYFRNFNTYNSFLDTGSTAPHTLWFEDSLTTPTTASSTIFNNFEVRGGPGRSVTIGRGLQGLYMTGSTKVSCDYLIVSNSLAFPNNKWYAGFNSVDPNFDIYNPIFTTGTTNTRGWVFTDPPSSSMFISGIG
jgi:hypothetical protein